MPFKELNLFSTEKSKGTRNVEAILYFEQNLFYLSDTHSSESKVNICNNKAVSVCDSSCMQCTCVLQNNITFKQVHISHALGSVESMRKLFLLKMMPSIMELKEKIIFIGSNNNLD
jgi:hypothetical protein